MSGWGGHATRRYFGLSAFILFYQGFFFFSIYFLQSVIYSNRYSKYRRRAGSTELGYHTFGVFVQMSRAQKIYRLVMYLRSIYNVEKQASTIYSVLYIQNPWLWYPFLRCTRQTYQQTGWRSFLAQSINNLIHFSSHLSQLSCFYLCLCFVVERECTIHWSVYVSEAGTFVYPQLYRPLNG